MKEIFLVISSFVFVVDSTMNLMSEFHYIWLWEKEIPMFMLREYLRITHNKNINYIVNCIKKREKKFKNKKERNSDASQDQLGRLNKKIQPIGKAK